MVGGGIPKQVEKKTQLNPLDQMTGMPVESNISRHITETTTKIVIIIILSLLFFLPFFELTTYTSSNSQLSVGFNLLTDYYQQIALDPQNFNFSIYEGMHQFFIDEHKNYTYDLIYYQMPFNQNFTPVKISDYRSDELEIVNGVSYFNANSDIPKW